MSPVLRAAFRPIVVFLWAYLGIHATFAVLQSDRASHPLLWLATLAASLLWIVLVHMTRAIQPWINLLAILTVPLSVWSTFANLDAAALATYANWWPGPCAVLAALFILYGRSRCGTVTVVAGVLSSAAISRADFPDAGAAVGYTLSAASGPIVWSLGFAGILVLISRFSDSQLKLESHSARQAVAVESGRQALERHDRDVEVMRSASVSLLQDIARLRPGAEITPRQRETWRLGALLLRDELASRAFLDDGVRQAIRLARGRGVVVDLQDGYAEGGDLGPFTRLFIAATVRRMQSGERLSVRRQAGRNVLTMVYVGPGAGQWLRRLPAPPAEFRVISEDELAHLSCDCDVLEWWCGGQAPERGSGGLTTRSSVRA
jgi:hypothetical protein